MRYWSLCSALVVVAALAPARAAEPTVEDDLGALKGTWVSPEVSFKRGKTTVTVQITAEFRGKGEGTASVAQKYAPPVEAGGGLVTGGSREPAFKYAIEEKDGKRLLRLSGTAFLRPSDEKGKEGKEKLREFPAVTAYRLKADKIELDTVEVMVWPLVGGLEPAELVKFKGTWKRVKEKK
jgi:hypothetical protein